MARAVTTWLGCLALVGCSGAVEPRGAATRPAGARVAPQGLYGVDPGSGKLIYIDPETAAVTPIGPLGLGVGTTGADFACDGTFWAFSAEGGSAMALYTADLDTGAGTVVRRFDVAGLATTAGFEFGPDETAMFWRNGPGLYRLDPATGTADLLGTGGGGGVSLTMPASCDQFLGSDCVSGACRIVRIDPATGAVATVGDTVATGFTSLAATPDGRLFGHTGGSLYGVDPATGAATRVGPIVGDGVTYQPVGMAYGPAGVCCRPLDCSTAAPTPATLWPPDHRLVEVGVAGVEGAGESPVEVVITGIRQDEPVDATGDGHTAPDAFLAGSKATLRAERAGGGDGRVYHLAFTAASGSRSCQGTVEVCVPQDRGKGASCVDQGPRFDSTASGTPAASGPNLP